MQMMNFVYRAYVGNNPGGIEINLGYYALAECILTNHDPGKVLLRWCNVGFDSAKDRRFRNTVIMDIDRLKEIVKTRFLTYQYIADITGHKRHTIASMFVQKHTHYPKEFVSLLEEELGLKPGELIVKEFDHENNSDCKRI